MRTKKTSKKQTSARSTKVLNAVSQHNDEIIDKEELEKRGGITGDKDDYFILFLKEYHRGCLHYLHAKNLIDVALYIASRKELYVTVNHQFRLMKISSITEKLRQFNKEVKKDLEEETKAKEEYINKYKHKK